MPSIREGAQHGDVRPTPIFIVGNVHSGTTLLQNVISNHPDVFSGQGESAFFHHLPTIRRQFADLNDAATLQRFVVFLLKIILVGYNKVNFGTAQTMAADFRAWGIDQTQVDQLIMLAQQNRHHVKLFVLVNEYLAALDTKQFWLEKTPGHIHQLEQILRTCPTARVIEMVRDPRDILASKQARRSAAWLAQTTAAAGDYLHLMGGFDPVWDTMSWKAAVQAGMSAQVRYPDQIRRVRYEDFVAAPQAELAAICHFLGLAVDAARLEAMVAVDWRNTTTQKMPGAQGIGTNSVGKWQTQLPPETVALCQWLTKREASALNYIPGKVPLLSTLKVPFLLMHSGVELWQRMRRRWHLGGNLYLLTQFQNYRTRLFNLWHSRTAKG